MRTFITNINKKVIAWLKDLIAFFYKPLHWKKKKELNQYTSIKQFIIDYIYKAVIIIVWFAWLWLHLLPLTQAWALFLYLAYPIAWLIFTLQGMRLVKYGQANNIVFGGKGKGKSLIFQYLINHDKQPLGNIDFGKNKVVPPFQFFESIRPNTSRTMIDNTLTIVQKITSFEGRNYYFDDTNMFAPNIEDSYLKQHYKSMALFILGQRHYYNSCTILNAQSLDRIYKNLRELQLDGYIKARGQLGFGKLLSYLPIFRKYVFLSYIYYEQYETANSGKLPYKEIAVLDKTLSPLHVGAGRALEKIYNAENGLIFSGFVALKKKHIYFDTREYHKWLFGYEAPK